MQPYSTHQRMVRMFEGYNSYDQREIVNVLHEIEQKNEKSAINLVNALFLSSNSQSLDKVCLNIFVKIGDKRSLRLLYKKYPTPQTISMSLLPTYIQALAHLGEKEEVELLGRVANAFGGLYRTELIDAFERIASRIGATDVSNDVVGALNKLYDVTDHTERKRILELTQQFSNSLLISLLLRGLESESSLVKRASIEALGALGTDLAKREIVRAFKQEFDEELLEVYEPYVFNTSDT